MLGYNEKLEGIKSLIERQFEYIDLMVQLNILCLIGISIIILFKIASLIYKLIKK